MEDTLEHTINKHIAASLEADALLPWRLKPCLLGGWSLTSLEADASLPWRLEPDLQGGWNLTSK